MYELQALDDDRWITLLTWDEYPNMDNVELNHELYTKQRIVQVMNVFYDSEY